MSELIIVSIIAIIIILIIIMDLRKEHLVNSTRQVTLHYVNWCPHCRVMKPIWERVKMATNGSGIIFKEVDEEVAKTPGITGYPTILMIDEAGHKHQYDGVPDFIRLRNWIVSPIVP